MTLSPDGRLVATGTSDGIVRLWELATGREIKHFQAHRESVQTLSFSPDGKRLASGSADTSILVWSVSTLIKSEKAMNAKLLPEDAGGMKLLWSELAEADSPRAYGAISSLVARPDLSLPYLRSHINKVKPPDCKQINLLLTDLASEFPWIWDEARIKLIALGEVVEGPVRAALDKKPSPDLKEHLHDVLEALKDPANHLPSPDELRQLRAVAVLEHIGGAEAKAILKELATGYAKARVTRDAAESLERLAKRP